MGLGARVVLVVLSHRGRASRPRSVDDSDVSSDCRHGPANLDHRGGRSRATHLVDRRTGCFRGFHLNGFHLNGFHPNGRYSNGRCRSDCFSSAHCHQMGATMTHETWAAMLRPVWPNGSKTNKRTAGNTRAVRSLIEIRRRPTLPGDHSPSTIGADRLNFRVRDGNGCDPVAMVTEISCQ
jgi:hypothetical protein